MKNSWLGFFKKEKHAPDLLRDPVFPLLIRIAIPAGMAFMFQIFYIWIDTFWAGQLGSESVAVITLGFPFFLVLQALPMGITAASSVLQANELGKQNTKQADKLFKQAIVFAIGFSLVARFLATFIADPIIHTVYGNIPLEIRERALDYLNIRFATGTVFVSILLVLNSALVARGDTKTNRNITIFAFALNFMLAPLFSMGLEWRTLPLLEGAVGLQAIGFMFQNAFITLSNFALTTLGLQETGLIWSGFREIGLGWAYVIVQAINAFIIFLVLIKRKVFLSWNLLGFIPHWKTFKRILWQGIPATLNSLNVAVGLFVIQYFVAKFGTSATSGYGSGIRIEQLFLVSSTGISTALMAIASQNYGAGNILRIREAFRSAYFMAFAVFITMIIVIWGFAPVLLLIFVRDPIVIAYGVSYLRITAVGCILAYLTFSICFATLQSIKKPKFFLFVSVYRLLLINWPIYYLFTEVLQWGIQGLWMSVILVNGSAGIILFVRTRYHLNHLEAYLNTQKEGEVQAALDSSNS